MITIFFLCACFALCDSFTSSTNGLQRTQLNFRSADHKATATTSEDVSGAAQCSNLYDVVVVGAGIGGLVTASGLAQRGLSVKLFEKQPYLGGRCGSELVQIEIAKDEQVWKGGDYGAEGAEAPDAGTVSTSLAFRFDVGPSLLLLPDVYERTFASLGVDIHSALQLLPVLPFYRCFFQEDRTHLDITPDEAAMEAQVEAVEKGAWPAFQRYMAAAKGFLDFGLPVFIEERYQLKGLLQFLQSCLVCFPLLSHSAMLSGLFKSPKLQAMLSFQDLYVGLSPYEAPAVFSLLQALEFDRQIYYPRGGFGAVTEALAMIAQQSGVEVETGVAVRGVSFDAQGNHVLQ
ncbi:hypothetical protein B484DRAFT_435080, partial [Ochromonadaceae sp. CCMP2298]